MTRLALVLLLFTSVASADEPAPQGIVARRTTCKPNGSVWFEIQQADTAKDAVQTSVKLFGNGAVTITRTRGTRSSSEPGQCLVPRQMQYVESMLKQAPWKTTPISRKGNCKTASTASAVIKVFDKPVFTEKACPDDELDAKSRANLARLRGMLPSAALPKDCDKNPLAKGCV